MSGVMSLVLRSELRNRPLLWLLVALLVAAGGGAGAAAIAGARRTATAYPRALVASDAPDHVVDLDGNVPDRVVADIVDHPAVESASSSVALAITRFDEDDEPIFTEPNNVIASRDGGRFYDHDSLSVVEGRMPHPERADEVLANETFAERVSVGDEIELGASQLEAVFAYRPGTPVPHEPITVTVVGVGVLIEQVAHDDVATESLLVGSPAMAQRYADSVLFQRLAVELRPGADLAAFKRDVQTSLEPLETSALFEDRGLITERTERAVRPYTLALAAVGLFVLGGTALIAGQAVARAVNEGEATAIALRAAGSDRPTVIAALAAPGVSAAAAGTAIGLTLAIALSPLSPVGVVRDVEPSAGLAVDLISLGTALGAMFAVIVVRAVAAARGVTSAASQPMRAEIRSGTVVRALARAGAPFTTVLGARQAIGAGSGRRTAIARLAMVSAGSAIVVLAAIATIDRGVDHLLATPRLYGNAWDAAVVAEGGYGSVDVEALRDDPAVEALTGAAFGTTTLDGTEVPALGLLPFERPMHPPIVAGRAPVAGAAEVAVGGDTLDLLDRELGDRVEMLPPDSDEPIQVEIVGVAVLPALGFSDTDRPALGRGMTMVFDPNEAAEFLQPNAALVDLREGELGAFTDRHVDRRVDTDVYADPRPADIAAFAEIGTLPTVLAALFGLVALAALAHAVASGARSHRRDLAIVRALGARRRQRRDVLLQQALICAVIASAVGLPLGAAIGRASWRALAADIGVVESAPVPAVSMLLVAVAACAMALAVGQLSARRQDRARVVDLLRTE